MNEEKLKIDSREFIDLSEVALAQDRSQAESRRILFSLRISK